MKSDNVILIPARAGSTNISRQNLRLVGNKPLIYYVIKSALKITENVYVSTDSYEIKEISKLYGAKTIDRPKNLTKNSSKLEDIALHALFQICQNNDYSKCLILNPKYPLIKHTTIKSFFTTLDNKIQTIFGYESYPHHQYKKISLSRKTPLLTDDITNCVITEKIVSFNIKRFLKTKKFESPSFGIKLSENEPLALNSYHDFGILEKTLHRKRILVRVNGSDKIGLGHVHNMLTILNHFRNEEILIVMKSVSNLGQKKFEENLYNVRTFSKDAELFKIIEKFSPDMIFNDILNTSTHYMKKIINKKIFTVNFEDLGNGRKYANLVFNPIYHSSQNNSNEFFGPNYACVRDEFRMWTPNKLRQIPKNIVIIFGGLDPTNKTYQILKLIYNYNLKAINYSIIIGSDYKERKNLLHLISMMKQKNFSITLNQNVDFLSKIFHESDFAITSNGRTVFELGSLHVPMIVIPVNQREKKHTFVEKYHVGYIVKLENESKSKNFLKIFTRMQKPETRKKFQNNLKQLNLLYGVDRVVNKINNSFEMMIKEKQAL